MLIDTGSLNTPNHSAKRLRTVAPASFIARSAGNLFRCLRPRLEERIAAGQEVQLADLSDDVSITHRPDPATRRKAGHTFGSASPILLLIPKSARILNARQYRGGLHCPECCHGAYCCRHCPVCTGEVVVPEDEQDAMRRNRDAQARFRPDDPLLWASRLDGRGRWPRQRRLRGELPPDAWLLVAGTCVRMHGRRKRFYDLIESGMSVRAFFEKCQGRDCRVRGRISAC